MSDRIAAVVLAMNAMDTVPLVVAAIEAQTIVPTMIVVVDNGSTDGTPEWVRSQPGLRGVFLEQNLGVGAGHNHGWTFAQQQDPELTFIWALEHDTIPEPGCLERLLHTLAARESDGARVGAVVPKQRLPEEAVSTKPPVPFDHWEFSFNGTLFPTDALVAVGPIREDFFIGHEDRELALRLTDAGFVIVKDPGARVVHRNKRARHRSRPSVLRCYYSNRNEAYLMVHVRRERLGRLRVLGRTVGGVGRALLREEPRGPRARARIRATFDGLRGDLGKKRYSFLESRR